MARKPKVSIIYEPPERSLGNIVVGGLLGAAKFSPEPALLFPVRPPKAWMGGKAGKEIVFGAEPWEAWTGLRECASMPQPTRKLKTLTIAIQ
jgi:hypothetical protein